jgi:O-methyltransferase involved in polyketide biosynthesis
MRIVPDPFQEIRLPPPSAASAAAHLSAVPSTLRIPLAARALGDALFPEVAVGDADAARILAAIGDDGSAWLGDRASVYGVLARTRRFRELAGRFLAATPDGHVANLGCGLSNYIQWLDNGRMRMTDADLPETLAVRRGLLQPASPRHVVREFDLTAPDWWDRLGLPASRDEPPVFVQVEGVFMYLEPALAHAVLRRFGERAPAGSSLVFDVMCWLAAGRARYHPSVGRTGAEFRWGPRRMAELTEDSPRLQLAATHSIMDGYGLPYLAMDAGFRFFCGVPLYAIYELHTR